MFGRHLLLHWSRTQQTIALSSAEAELNAACKGAQEGIAARIMSEEMGMPKSLRMSTDASAALGIIGRQGAGKIKHLEIRQLWLQERVRNRNMSIRKIPRDINSADLFTHYWAERDGVAHLTRMGCVRRSRNSEMNLDHLRCRQFI